MADVAQASEAIKFFGETLGFWVQTAAFSLSAIGAVAVISHNSVLARRRATIDHIIHQKTDGELLAAINIVYELHDKKEPLSKFFGLRGSDEHKAILQVLNNHEFIALGIRRRAFEERIYKELQCSNFIKVWSASSGLVAELRRAEGRDTLFQEFEWLAKRWTTKPLRTH